MVLSKSLVQMMWLSLSNDANKVIKGTIPLFVQDDQKAIQEDFFDHVMVSASESYKANGIINDTTVSV